MKPWLALILLFAAPAFAQGSVQGRAINAADPGTLLSDPAQACVVVLSDDSIPFGEIVTATWQQAMSDLADKRAVTTPFGKLEGGMPPTAAFTAPVDGNGDFRVDNLPLEARLGLAVKVDGIWWPLAEELWLTTAQPAARPTVSYCRLGADPPVLELLHLQAGPVVRQDLKYGGIALRERARLTNMDPARGALVEITLDVAMVPGITAQHLPGMYGNQLLYMQGWNLVDPHVLERDIRARQAWVMGGGDAMHGGQADYGKGPQRSADNWHPLNDEEVLAMCGAGDTLFQENPSPDGRSASLVFRRVVPPARNGKPGVLEIRLMHQAGVRTADPGQKIRLVRSFKMPLAKAAATILQGVVLQSLVTDAHRKFFGEGQADGRATGYSSAQTPALGAGETVELILGFDAALQKQLSDLEAAALAKQQPENAGNEPATGEQAPGLRSQVIFQALAALFGVAFLVALVASIRKPREAQLERLNRLPAPREELLTALAELEADFSARKLPATAYLEQKQRLMNRLVEADSGGKP